jgi:hypothetical protein
MFLLRWIFRSVLLGVVVRLLRALFPALGWLLRILRR